MFRLTLYLGPYELTYIKNYVIIFRYAAVYIRRAALNRMNYYQSIVCVLSNFNGNLRN